MAEKNTFNKGEKAASRSALTLIVLGIIKASVAFVSGSTALIAGTIDTFSDVFSSVAVWVGLRIANKKSTERFPYGYFKAETFALLIVSMIIIASSILIMLESWQKLFETATISFSSIALITAAISAVIYYLLANIKKGLVARLALKH
jgi:cation diffusion facilitator family transporter